MAVGAQLPRAPSLAAVARPRRPATVLHLQAAACLARDHLLWRATPKAAAVVAVARGLVVVAQAEFRER